MKKKPIPNAATKTLTLTLLITLAVMNGVWSFLSSWGGASIATVLYAIVALRWYLKDYISGAIAGVLGFGIHLYVLLFHPLADLRVFETVFFYMNLLLPIPIAVLGYLAYRDSRKKTGHSNR
jgi:hypothetical protein